MKKRILPLSLAVLVLANIFSGCAVKSMLSNNTASTDAYIREETFDYIKEVDWDYDVSKEAQYDSEEITGVIATASKTYALESEKIIYTAYAELETLQFDETVENVYDMLEQFEAYIENSSVTGTDYATKYYGGRSYREANFSVRVPVQNYSAMSVELNNIGNVISFSSQSQNITTQYTDTESRLKAYRIEYERLLEMMEKAESVDEMISVESRLSEVEYNIESLTSALRVWQDKVDYSTINICVIEVYEYSEPSVQPRSFGDKIHEAFASSVKWLGEAGENIVVFIVGAVPVLIIPAAVIIVILFCLRAKRKKKSELRAAEEEKAAALREEWKNKHSDGNE